MSEQKKLIVLVGPTAVGKSTVGVSLARKFGGEVISADSRQVYRGLDIGTGKITPEEMGDVPHHLLDMVEPQVRFSVADWKERAEMVISDILNRGQLPILVGGTGFYIQAIVDNFTPPPVSPNEQRRTELDRLSINELNQLLKKLDPERQQTIDQQNKRRLVRAVEVAEVLGQVPPRVDGQESKYNALQIGLVLPQSELKEKISQRLQKRIAGGMIAEARQLYQAGVSLERMAELGLEYRYLARYLAGQIDKKHMQEQLETEIRHYAKRQLTWFKRDCRIEWFDPAEESHIQQRVREFLTS